jgi:nucleoside-diphosphate-sugar epimerase
MMNDGLKIPATDGAGGPGSILIPALPEAGHRVTALDSFLFRRVSLAHACARPNFETMKDRLYNVGLSSADLSKRELRRGIARHLPKFVFPEAPIGEDPGKRGYIVSNERIEATGYKPAYPPDDGVRERIKGHRMLRNSLYGDV